MKTHDQKRRIDELKSKGLLLPSQITTWGRYVRIQAPPSIRGGDFSIVVRDYCNEEEAEESQSRLITMIIRGVNVKNHHTAARKLLNTFG